MTDLSSLNQHVDQKITQAIIEIRQKFSKKVGIAIKGDRGTGKSHVIHRIWKNIERDGQAVFSYIPPCKNPNRIDSHVRVSLCLDFNRQDAYGITQWQKLAAAAISTLKGTEYEKEYKEYVEKCDQPDLLRKYIIATVAKSEIENFFDNLTENILENQPELDFNFLKAALFTLFKNLKVAQVGLAWLKGDDHPYIKQAGLPEYSADQQDQRSIWIIQQVCKLAEVVRAPVVICFDQLDSVEPNLETGDSKAQVVARCLDRIYFQCSNVILLCCVISDTWREIEHMGSGIPDRVGQWAVSTKPPTADQIVELVKLRLDWFYNQNQLNSTDYPYLYPFEESELRKVASEAAGARAFFRNWCAKRFEEHQQPFPGNPPTSPAPPSDPDEKAKTELLNLYNELLTKVQVSKKEKDDDGLAAILTCAMRMVPNRGTANVVITQVEEIRASNHDLHLVVSGYDSLHQKKVRIGIRACETTNGISFNAVMKRLLDYKKYKLTRGCLVRSTPIPLNWRKGKELETQLVNRQGGEVVVLNYSDLKPLVVLERIYKQAEDYGFKQEQLIALIQELGLVTDNPLICEILSAPEAE
ncbi:MAG: hypothetical protein KME43_18935 [Myxacorys chilensis ATA2-1-KO14]|nr:hypothetical protein [Myxacorys chilensis ATA2-1-KO14]